MSKREVQPTIEEIAKKPKRRGRKYTLYLTIEFMNYIEQHGGKANMSRVVDKIIGIYVNKLKAKKID